ncbi:MAG: right-handed parallel beta-helix repeat-containing protein [Spirochaetales bacterium]|nr:right-handed parallel beta-helix repeat-containing protein [Spirochaetales bacterium]
MVVPRILGVLGLVLVSLISCVSLPERPGYPGTGSIDPELFAQGVPITNWGYDAEDSTRYIQAAFDSEVPVLLFPAEPGIWVSDQLRLPSNKIILFAPGAILEAKRGAFPGGGDMLLKGDVVQNLSILGYGAEIRMWKTDYQNPPYHPAEWRNTLGLYNSHNVLIEGLTLSSSGGDGVYLGAFQSEERSWNSDITLRNLHIRDHHRQGISVISVKGLVVDSCLIEGTEGTPPGAGIDFEPNRPYEQLTEIRVMNTLIRNNQGPGILFHFQFLDRTSMPVDISIENTIVEGNLFNLSFMGVRKDPQGEIRFLDSTTPPPHFRLQRSISILGLEDS